MQQKHTKIAILQNAWLFLQLQEQIMQ